MITMNAQECFAGSVSVMPRQKNNVLAVQRSRYAISFMFCILNFAETPSVTGRESLID